MRLPGLDFLKNWMLPIAMVTGVSLYLIYHFTPALHPYGHLAGIVASEGQRLVIALLLFFQFVKVAPGDIGLRRWHLWALLLQALLFLLFAVVALCTPEGEIRILVECAMLCLICPTASAAGVITERLGGKLNETVSYLALINAVATLLIPAVIPLVNPSAQLGFWAYVLRLAAKVFPVLILPCLLAWLIRYTFPQLQERLARWASKSFYIWGIGLTLALLLSTRALLLSRLSAGSLLCIVLISISCCALQFAAGRRMGRSPSENLTAGQALGQKNTGFLIWLGYNYMTPVTSVAGGLYAIWQNLFNSWELYEKRNATSRQTKH